VDLDAIDAKVPLIGSVGEGDKRGSITALHCGRGKLVSHSNDPADWGVIRVVGVVPEARQNVSESIHSVIGTSPHLPKNGAILELQR
jgi:hypothetical protein